MYLRLKLGFTTKDPAFPFADRGLLAAHDSRTGRAIPLPVVGNGKGLPAHCTSLHPGRESFIIAILVAPYGIGHKVVQAPVCRKHAGKKIVTIHCSVMDGFVGWMDHLAPVIRLKTVAVSVVGTRFPGKCADASLHLLLGHITQKVSITPYGGYHPPS